MEIIQKPINVPKMTKKEQKQINKRINNFRQNFDKEEIEKKLINSEDWNID